MEDQTQKDLNFIADQLPHGAITKIAIKCGFTPQYVSRFFNGEFEITSANIQVLEEANIILEDEKAAKEKGASIIEKNKGK